MSHFTVAINDVLDRLKASSGITRQEFAKRADIPLSTFTNYTKERNLPDLDAITKIDAALDDEDAARVVKAHVLDNAPIRWRDKIILQDSASATPVTVSLEEFPLPPVFKRNVELILGEARSNEHIIAFVEEFVVLLGLAEAPVETCPNFPVQKIPAEPVLIKSPTTDSTATPARRAESDAVKVKK